MRSGRRRPQKKKILACASLSMSSTNDAMEDRRERETASISQPFAVTLHSLRRSAARPRVRRSRAYKTSAARPTARFPRRNARSRGRSRLWPSDRPGSEPGDGRSPKPLATPSTRTPENPFRQSAPQLSSGEPVHRRSTTRLERHETSISLAFNDEHPLALLDTLGGQRQPQLPFRKKRSQ